MLETQCIQNVTYSIRKDGVGVYSILRNKLLIGFCHFLDTEDGKVSIPTQLSIEELPVVQILLEKLKRKIENNSDTESPCHSRVDDPCFDADDDEESTCTHERLHVDLHEAPYHSRVDPYFDAEIVVDSKSSKFDNKMADNEIKHINGTGCCPKCKTGDLIGGPCGGSSQNYRCQNCGEEFNLGFSGPSVWIGESQGINDSRKRTLHRGNSFSGNE